MEPSRQLFCPHCGTPMLPHSNGAEAPIQYVCPRCPSNEKPPIHLDDRSFQNPTAAAEEPRTRFRRLLESEDASSDLALPAWLIEDLPEDARQLLTQDQTQVRPSIGPRLSDDLAQALRDQGYVIDEDSRGLRISGHPNSYRGKSGQMSPYDVLRMAADLEGRVQDLSDCQHCPECDAVIPGGRDTCEWCGFRRD